jgi:type III restriction enzyme
MQDKKTFSQKELVLKVSSNYDPDKLNLNPWRTYIERLTEGRRYQYEAIEASIIYMASGKYSSINDLVSENYAKNHEIQAKYSSLSEYLSQLQLPGFLYANIDLATATGKSYVIFGIAQIMLGLGIIDKVLVLTPSVTIEDGLTEKFLSLSSDEKLRSAIPENAIISNPRIVNGNITVKTGDICVENIHAVYEKTGSSIVDSFQGSGERTLVLCDESHHVFNKISGNSKEIQDIKKWKHFLMDKKYRFKYIIGFTGTAYIDNEYFNDIIYRYSLRQAIDDGIVKNIEYVQKDDSINIDEKFQKIYQNHTHNKDKYMKLKPISILITKDISKAKKLYNDIVDFLVLEENISRKTAEDKVLIVTSDSKHKTNVLKLKYVDESSSPVEWIVSVSMLTEGWDVKNVFQIVPWEDKAFNSKLLIAQVLGRGLRKPLSYINSLPIVTVFNHDSWSKNIKELVREILEIETRVYSESLNCGVREKYHFEVYNIDYTKVETEVSAEVTVNNVKNFTEMQDKGISLESQVLSANKETVYDTISESSSIPREVSYVINFSYWTIDEILDKIYNEFEIRDWEGKILKLKDGEYTQNNLPPRNVIREIIEKSLLKVGILGDKIVEKNAYRILTSFSTLLRKKEKSVVQKSISNEPYCISTKSIQKASTAVGNLRRGSTLFYTSDFESELTDEIQKTVIRDLNEDLTLLRSSLSEKNPYTFKTPFSTVITSFEPERKFVELLCKDENAQVIDSWIKSRDRGFYQIEYSLKYGDKLSRTRGYKRSQFNPDFFIKISKNEKDYILVVETKSDGDDSEENKAKYKYGKEHFDTLNNKLEKHNKNSRYLFHFLSPNGYNSFFEYLRNGSLLESQEKYRCELENILEENL